MADRWMAMFWRVDERALGAGNGLRWSSRQLPAWALSVLLHAVIFLTAGLSLRTASLLESDQAERQVGIVLRPGTWATATPLGTPEEPRDRSSEVPTSQGSLPLSDPSLMAIPSAGAAAGLIPVELSLPGGAAPRLNGEGTVAVARFVEAPRGRSSVATAADVGATIRDDQAWLASQRPQGEPVQVRLFGGGAAEGRSFVFLVDRSRSMGGDGLGALVEAERELLSAIRGLLPVHRFQVIAYHHQCVYLRRREMLAGDDENRRAVAGFLSGLTPFGATNHELALLSALQHGPDVIFLLTDGGEPALSENQLRGITRQAGGRTAIHCVEFGRGPRNAAGDFLERLARHNGGGHSYVDLSQTR